MGWGGGVERTLAHNGVGGGGAAKKEGNATRMKCGRGVVAVAGGLVVYILLTDSGGGGGGGGGGKGIGIGYYHRWHVFQLDACP